MHQIAINELKQHPRNNEFFDDITGDKWNDFVRSIRTSGVIEPIRITQDNIIVSGHQRVRACKELGIVSVPCTQNIYKNDDLVLKDLIETNIMQRGSGNENPFKMGKCIKFLEKCYGIQHGGDRISNTNASNGEVRHMPTQAELAAQLGISERGLREYKELTKIIPEFEQLFGMGKLSKTAALAIVNKLSPDEQEQFYKEVDATQKISAKVVEEYVEKIRILENKNLAQTDALQEYEIKIHDLERQLALTKQNHQEYERLKADIQELVKQKTDFVKQLHSMEKLGKFNSDVREFLEYTLAPATCMQCLDYLSVDEVVFHNLKDSVDKVQKWVDEMRHIIGDIEIIDMEVI